MEKQNDVSPQGELPKEISAIINSLPENEQGEALRAVGKIEMRRFSLPMPPPKLLEEYVKLIPDSPERLLVMAEKGQEADIDIRRNMIDGQSRLNKYKFIQSVTDAFIFLAVIIIVVFVGFVLVLKGYGEIALRFWGGGGIAVVIISALAAYFRRKK